MKRKPKIDPALKGIVRGLKAKGLSRKRIQAALAQEGHEVSTGWISLACSDSAPLPRKKTPAKPPAVDDDELSELESTPGGGTSLEDVRRDLGRLTGILRRKLDEAAGDDVCDACGRGASDVDAVTKIGRVLAAASQIIARIQPEAAPDPNANPDMIDAAQRAREKLHELVERKRRAVA